MQHLKQAYSVEYDMTREHKDIQSNKYKKYAKGNSMCDWKNTDTQEKSINKVEENAKQDKIW